MKHLSSRWAAATLLLPVIVILALLASGGRAPEAATNSSKGTIEIALEGTVTLTDSGGNPIGIPVAQSFQRLFLNVVAVRLNPSSNANISDFDQHWVSILVPSGVGQRNTNAVVTTPFAGFGGFGNFGPGGNAVSLGQGRSEIQIDMNALQNGPEIFNSGLIAAKTYRQIELVLDPSTQGVAVPLCASQISPSGEGCVAYPAIFTPSATSSGLETVRTSSTIDITRGSFQTLLININLNVGPPPTSTENGGNPSKNSVAITPTISVPGSQTAAPGLGTLSGTVKNESNKKVKVVAELSGTNQIVASTGVVKGSYSMSLPALPSTGSSCTGTGGNGTLYDIYTTGDGEYQIRSGVAVCANQPTTGVDFTVVPASLGQLIGAVFDACNSGVKVPSATLVLYAPDTAVTSSCTFDSFGNVTPSPGCVAVATAQSDATGAFPLPGNTITRPPFQTVPVKVPAGVTYALKVTASGFNGLVEPVTADGKTLKCKDLGNKNNSCDNIALEHGQLTTTINLDSPSASGSNIMVMAEDHSNGAGFLNIESIGMANIPAGATSGSVTMNVPDNGAGGSATPCDGTTPDQFCTLGTEIPPNTSISFDVFGQVQDLYFGAPQNATGHTIEVTSGPAGAGIAGPSRCAPTQDAATLSGFGCAGHGSIAGFITSSDPFSSVVISKGGVDLMQSGVAPLIIPSGQNLSNGSEYSFCVPGSDTYSLQHFENLPNAVPSPVPGGGPITVNVPAPLATSTAGCSSICKSGGNCLLCNGTVLTSPIN